MTIKSAAKLENGLLSILESADLCFQSAKKSIEEVRKMQNLSAPTALASATFLTNYKFNSCGSTPLSILDDISNASLQQIFKVQAQSIALNCVS